MSPEDGRDWEDEPSEEQIHWIISELKRDILKKYPLQLTDELTPARPQLLVNSNTEAERDQHKCWLDARKCLESIVFTVKTLVPKRYFHLFDSLLTDWMPEIS